MFKGIVGKLWFAMALLLISIILAMGTVLSEQFQAAFVNQQWNEMLGHGRELAKIITESEDKGDIQREITFWDRISGFKISVVDTSGKILYSSDPDKAPVGSMMNVAELSRVFAGEEATINRHHPIYGKDMLSVLVPIKTNGKVEGAVMLHYSLEHISEFFQRLQRTYLFIIMVSLVLASFLALLLARVLAVPLLKMKQVAVRMSEGDFDSKIEVTSNDEIGLLGDSLNTLSTRLEATLSDLESKNQELGRMLTQQKEFVANVSHELRSPLFLIQGYTEAMLDGLATNNTLKEKSLQVMLDETMRLSRLVEDLLTLSRTAQEGSGGLEMGRVTLPTIIYHVSSKFEQFAQQKRVTIKPDIQDGLPTVIGNSDRLEQVFTNLIDNALRYSPEGGTIIVSAGEVPAGIMVTVADQGIGIPPEELPLIWERFYKVDKARIRKGMGTGLGLAIAWNIIKSHKGDIWAESTPGKGTEFKFILRKEP